MSESAKNGEFLHLATQSLLNKKFIMKRSESLLPPDTHCAVSCVKLEMGSCRIGKGECKIGNSLSSQNCSVLAIAKMASGGRGQSSQNIGNKFSIHT